MNLLCLHKWWLLITLLCAASQCRGQREIFIQLEDELTSVAYRYFPGDKITFQTKEYPDTWRKAKIKEIIPQDSILVLDEGYVKVGDISRVRRPKGRWGKIIGASIMSFGSGVVVYGTIGHLSSGEPKSAGLAALVGGAITGLGWLISKSGRKKKYKIGNHTHLRIYDIRWEVPGEVKPKV